jgi:hypothetical protein
MRLFKLTLATIFRRKTWAICALLVVAFPFLFQLLSSAPENPAMLKPTIAQATWVMAWVATLFWGFFAAAKAGESNARSGLGEYFRTTGVSATRQLLEIWAAVAVYVAPLGLAAALVCIFAASPAHPDERVMWININFQYALLFALVVAPLIALAIAVASRFGSLTGFLASAGLGLYGLYGVGYLKMLLQVETNPVLQWVWTVSPHYHFADPTERLRYKMGAIEWSQFPLLLLYFAGIFLLYTAFSRLLFRTKPAV